MFNTHFTLGDGKGWALDEDLRQIRLALKGMIVESSAAGAEVIHAPFWQNLGMVAPAILKRAFVIAHADNPPFFYLKQPEFLVGQQQVDLWVARSSEALNQFQALGLPAIHIPYTIDPGLFFPIEDKTAIRRQFAIPEDAYVVANFHRDTEGADLRTPKVQKNPEFMVAILRRLKGEGHLLHVLLAGPRRHWIRKALRKEGIPFSFVGNEVEGDDFGTNILDRVTLNRLYNAADLYLIPSRWEGGPQSAMEAAACGCKILSVPIGVGKDILEPTSLFRTSDEAAQKLRDDIRHGELGQTVEPQRARWEASHTTARLKQDLQELYRKIPEMESFRRKGAGRRIPSIFQGMAQTSFTIRRRITRPKLPPVVGWNHRSGVDVSLDRIMQSIEMMLEELSITIHKQPGEEVEIVGLPQWQRTVGSQLQWVVPGMPKEELIENAFLIAPSVQDVVNLRKQGCRQPAIAIPVLESAEKLSDEPFVVQAENQTASLQIWKAIREGRPVIYPEKSAYYEQVFHAGISYKDGENPYSFVGKAKEEAFELRKLSSIPSLWEGKERLKKLMYNVSLL